MLTITLEDVGGRRVLWEAVVYNSPQEAVDGLSLVSHDRIGLGKSTYDPVAAITEALNDYNERYRNKL